MPSRPLAYVGVWSPEYRSGRGTALVFQAMPRSESPMTFDFPRVCVLRLKRFKKRFGLRASTTQLFRRAPTT